MKKLSIFFLLFSVSLANYGQDFSTIDSLESYEGYFDFYYDASQDALYMEIAETGKEFLYVRALSSGLGHNDLELDRGQLGGEAVVLFRKSGDKMLLIQPNLAYRAASDNPLEKQAVKEAFARSVLYSFKILDESEGKFLVDIGPMLFSDAHGVADRLAAMQQGSYLLDRSRSAIELSRTRAFPENVEFDVLLTFNGKPEGRLVREVAPDAHHITVNQHHSFVKLPDRGYQPRAFHPQSACISMSYLDYSTPVYEPIKKQFIIRHRLEKKDPSSAISEPQEPIVYYLDRGTPEPVRSALLEGGSWWNEAFRSIGYENAFRVEMLPADADPLDVRYNVIQWVHRSTRGWSYGSSVVDPRTGEIIKGHVSLGSLRVRQDFMIAQALMDHPFASDDMNHGEMMKFALARIRQLSAHEIGHTLGFAHNFAASTNTRSSVMDYPHPLLRVENGNIVFDDAYDEGIGDWDKVTVAYAYTDFREDEAAGLEKILSDAHRQGLRFISDLDARSPGGAHPHAHLWDNGEDAVKQLQNVLSIRELAIQNFSTDNIREGEALSVLEDVFVPLYFFHRYQVEAVSKSIGGMHYSYSVKGDASEAPVYVDAHQQRAALDILLHTLSPDVLLIPSSKLDLFPPRAMGYSRSRESFKSMTGVSFDPLAGPAVLTSFTLEFLLHPERANRMLLQHSFDATFPGVEEVLEALLSETIYATAAGAGYEQELKHTVNFIVIDHLVQLANDPRSYAQVKAIVNGKLKTLREWLSKDKKVPFNDSYRMAYLSQVKDNKVRIISNLPPIPPGSPIGMDCFSE